MNYYFKEILSWDLKQLKRKSKNNYKKTCNNTNKNNKNNNNNYNIIHEITEEIDEELDNTRIRNNSPYIDLASTMGLENVENLIENDIEDEIIFNRIYDVKRSGIITRSKGLSKGLENDNIESLESLSNRPVDDDDNNMTFLDLIQDNRLNIEKPSSKRHRKKL